MGSFFIFEQIPHTFLVFHCWLWASKSGLGYSLTHFVPVFFLECSSLTRFWPGSHFIPPGNTRKPKVFCCFQGLQNGSIGKKSVKAKKIALCAIRLFHWSKFMILHGFWVYSVFARKCKWSISVQSLAVSPACGKPGGPRNSHGIDDFYADDWNRNM